MNYTDRHCHLLPGIDDGAADPGEAVAMARILSRAGFRRVVCTPHMLTATGENTPQMVRRATADLAALLDREGIELELHPGMEYYADEFLGRRMDDPLVMPGEALLVELPLRGDVRLFWDLLTDVTSRRLVPLIAHPERHPLLLPREQVRQGFLSSLFSRNRVDESPSALEVLREKGCRFQGNIGSFAGVYGEKVRSRAFTLLEQGWYDCLGTDAHRAEGLERVLEKGMAAVEKAAGAGQLEKLLSAREGT